MIYKRLEDITEEVLFEAKITGEPVSLLSCVHRDRAKFINHLVDIGLMQLTGNIEYISANRRRIYFTFTTDVKYYETRTDEPLLYEAGLEFNIEVGEGTED